MYLQVAGSVTWILFLFLNNMLTQKIMEKNLPIGDEIRDIDWVEHLN